MAQKLEVEEGIWEHLTKLYMHLHSDHAIPLLGIYPKDTPSTI